MARAAQQKVYADFRQGFVTVANPLAYPEGSVKDIENFDIKDNGTLATRPGLIQESNARLNTGKSLNSIGQVAMSLHVWDNVDNRGEDKLAVIQVADKLYLYKMLNNGIDMSSQEGLIDLPIPSSGHNIEISATSGNGWLFIAHPNMRPQALKKEEGGFVLEDIVIKIRDMSLWRGSDDNQTGFTSATLFPHHEYNLRNAGWPRSAMVSKTSNADDGVISSDPVTYTKTKLGKYPRISIPFHAARAGGGDTLLKQTAFNPWAIENDSYFGDSKPPVGRYIVDAEDWQRRGEGKGDTGTLTKKYSWTNYPSSVEFYAGRVWYSGAKGYKEAKDGPSQYEKKDDLNTSNTLYFSQQLDIDLNKVGLCYQENDPTAEDINQLLPTDGGTVSIRGAGEIFAIKAYRTSLLVFSNQGIWAVTGLDGNSFKADSSSINKISNIGPVSKEAISLTSDSIFFAADDAIYVVVQDDVTGLPSVQDMSSGLIKDFYNELSNSQKSSAKLSFDPSRRLFYMFYQDTEDTVEDTVFIPHNKVLVFNQDLGCYYKYNIDSYDNFIVSTLFYNKDNLTTVEQVVDIDGEAVTLDGEPVTLDFSFGEGSRNGIQILTLTEDGGQAYLYFSSFSDRETFSDWGVPFLPFVEFGFDVVGDIMRDSKKAPYIIAHMERTEDGYIKDPDDPEGLSLILSNPSSCRMSYAWDWGNSYKYLTELYRFNRVYTPYGQADGFNYGKDVITSKTRIRGKGTSLGLRLEGGYETDCRILGIGILYTVAQRV